VDPVVSARIQHGLFEGKDGFRSTCVRFRTWYERTSRRHRGPSGCSLGRALRRRYHPKYILTLTCKNPSSTTTARAGCGARTGRTRAGRPGNAGNPGLAASCPHGGVTGRTGHNAPAPVDPVDHVHHDGARTGRVVLRNLPGLAALERALREPTGRGAVRSRQLSG
jgi:hypothetical protein